MPRLLVPRAKETSQPYLQLPSGKCLPVQLIYGGKTGQSLPRYKFPDSFFVSVNEKHYSNKKESLKFFKEVIIPYIKRCFRQRILHQTSTH